MKKIYDVIVGVLIGTLIYVCVFCIFNLLENSTEQKNEPLIELRVPKSFDDLNAFIESLPDGAFKANLYIILATEYAGDSVELHAILHAYAKMQMQKLQREKNGETI